LYCRDPQNGNSEVNGSSATRWLWSEIDQLVYELTPAYVSQNVTSVGKPAYVPQNMTSAGKPAYVPQNVTSVGREEEIAIVEGKV